MSKDELLTGFKFGFYDTDYGFTTIAAAENCIKILKDGKLNFWLNNFSELMPEVDVILY